MTKWYSAGWPIPTICLVLLLGGLVVDLNTTQELVVAIIYAIPIAVSGAMTSRKLTWWCIALALLANVAAGYDNTAVSGLVDGTTMVNRLLAGLSIVLVGAMTLLLESSTEEVEHLSEVEDDSDRQRALRHFIVDLSGPLEPDQVMERAVRGLRQLLGADAVVATTLDGAVFDQPRWSDPPSSDLAAPGTAASWAVDALPVNDRPVIAVRSDQGMMSVGRWRCAADQDLVVLAARPDRRHAASLLGDALTVLAPIRERAVELADARAAAGRAGGRGDGRGSDSQRCGTDPSSSHQPADGRTVEVGHQGGEPQQVV